MNILERIIADKRLEVRLTKSVFPSASLEKFPLFNRPTFSLSRNLKSSQTGIIAEHKRRSPSKSVINQNMSVQEVAMGYEMAGVSGMSVLTDGKYFGGSLQDLTIARASCELPLLRKEFIVDEYQILEAKAYGADAILLIAACLTKQEIKSFSELAHQLSLEVLLEVHNKNELDEAMMPRLDMIGVNNRNLKTFEVSIETSLELSRYIPKEYVMVSESGLSEPSTIKDLRDHRFEGFLIGENFMKTENPGQSAKTFINQLKP